MTLHIRFFITLSLLAFAAPALRAQNGISDQINRDLDRGPSLETVEKAAHDALRAGNYATALEHFKTVLKDSPLHAPALEGYGRAATELGGYPAADSAYSRMVRHNLTGNDGEPILLLADIKYRLEQYDSARYWYQHYLDNRPPAATASQVKTALDRLESLAAIQRMQDESKGITVAPVDSGRVNTLASEYAHYIAGDTLYFSSSRYEYVNDPRRPRRDLLKTMTALPGGDTMTVQGVDFLNDGNRQHTAFLTFNEGGDELYYAQCEYKGKSEEYECALYHRRRQSSGEWGPAVKLPESINMPGLSVSQPALGRLPGDSSDVLFFVRNFRGGDRDDRDIWYSRLLRDSFTDPVNLTAVNTRGNEVTPFYHAPTATLYFSSDSLPSDSLVSVGGFDVFKVGAAAGNVWGRPVSAGVPINSGGNDVYFLLSRDSRTGYFSSNRQGAQNASEEGCCYDVFKANLIPPPPQILLLVTTYEKTTREPLNGVNVDFQEVAPERQEASRQNHPDDNRYEYQLQAGRDYTVAGSKPGFTSASESVSTRGITRDTTILRELYLQRGLEFIVTANCVRFKNKQGPVDSVTFRLVEVGGKLDTSFTNNAGNTFTAMISYDSRYVIYGYRNGYSQDSVEFSTRNLNTDQPFNRVEQKLDMCPYLPIQLFYDNDHPNPATRVPTTALEYRQTYLPYYNRKQEFINNYTGALSGQDRVSATDTLEDFFENGVRQGWEELLFYSDELGAILARGDTVKLILRGFASPLGQSEYNKILTGRRVSSVNNHFLRHDAGALNQYIKNGQLTIKLVPLGVDSSTGASGNPKNRRLSVYDVRAARARRLDIVGAQVQRKDGGTTPNPSPNSQK
jgi:tetratricopeptide (TPR) repeat protein